MSLPTLDDLEVTVKIKIVGRDKPSWVQRLSRAKRDDHELRPYHMRVRRDHGAGLWTIEDSAGQLYLAVLSRENSDNVRRLEEARAAHGRKSA